MAVNIRKFIRSLVFGLVVGIFAYIIALAVFSIVSIANLSAAQAAELIFALVLGGIGVMEGLEEVDSGKGQ